MKLIIQLFCYHFKWWLSSWYCTILSWKLDAGNTFWNGALSQVRMIPTLQWSNLRNNILTWTLVCWRNGSFHIDEWSTGDQCQSEGPDIIHLGVTGNGLGRVRAWIGYSSQWLWTANWSNRVEKKTDIGWSHQQVELWWCFVIFRTYCSCVAMQYQVVTLDFCSHYFRISGDQCIVQCLCR